MTTRTIPTLPGLALATGAVCLFIAWALMPDAATNDAAHILTAVASARAHVHTSALLQLLGAALLVPGLLADSLRQRTGTLGRVIMSWGAMGMATDVVFHQLACAMTAPNLQADALVPLMTIMQTSELVPHAPLLLAFIAGPPVLGFQLRRREGAGWQFWLLIAPLFTVFASIITVRLAGAPKRLCALIVIAEVCAGLATLGLTRGRSAATRP